MIPAVAPDGGLFAIEKLEAHRQGVLHLAVSVFVFHGDRLLLQRRAPGKYHCGGLWANTCCTHPHWGESLPDSAARRLEEEMGLSLALTPGPTIDYAAAVGGGLREHERVQIFSARIDAAAPFPALAPDPEEVDATRWVRLASLNRMRSERDVELAPWFAIYLDRWCELGFEALEAAL